MSIPSPLNHGHLSPVDVDLDILTETDAETVDAGAENCEFGNSIDLDDELPGSVSDRAHGRASGTVTAQLSSSSATTTDSAVSSGTEAPSGVSSRRSSNNPFSDFKDYVRSRRQTVTSRVSRSTCHGLQLTSSEVTAKFSSQVATTILQRVRSRRTKLSGGKSAPTRSSTSTTRMTSSQPPTNDGFRCQRRRFVMQYVTRPRGLC